MVVAQAEMGAIGRYTFILAIAQLEQSPKMEWANDKKVIEKV